VGKSFLNSEIVGRLVGGSTRAERYLLGADQFGSECFSVGHWMVDDAVFTISAATQRCFSEMIKQMAANPRHKSHEKFKMPCDVEWQGRIVVTMNDDPYSLRGLPLMDGSIDDKVSFFRAVDKPPIVFPDKEELLQIIARELPHFAQYLLDFEIPEECEGSARYGVQNYHEATMRKTAERSSSTASFLEILEGWIKVYFTVNADAQQWKGTTVELLRELSKDPLTQSITRGYQAQDISRGLMALRHQGHKIEYTDSEGLTRKWTIVRETINDQTRTRFRNYPPSRQSWRK
jgi:hypothetical protein